MSATSGPRDIIDGRRLEASREPRSIKIAAAVWVLAVVLVFASLAVAGHTRNRTARYEPPRATPSLIEQTPGGIWFEQSVY
jgi:hypothetical protein